MASDSSNTRTPTEEAIQNDIVVAAQRQYFVITLTNYPNLLQRIQEFQQLPSDRRQQQRLRNIFIANGSTHPAIRHSVEHERLLYTELQYDLQQVIQAYFQRTRQSFPISLVFDCSNMPQH